MCNQTVCIHIRRCEPAMNVHRFYRLSISTDLFGVPVVLRQWGRIGTRGQQKIEIAADMQDAVFRVASIERSKRQRGYR